MVGHGSTVGGTACRPPAAAAGPTWTKLIGVVTPTWTGAIETAELYIGLPWTTDGFWVDDVELVEASVASGPANRVVPATWRRELNDVP